LTLGCLLVYLPPEAVHMSVQCMLSSDPPFRAATVAALIPVEASGSRSPDPSGLPADSLIDGREERTNE